MTNPRKLISQLPLLDTAKQKQLLYGFNDTSVDYPAHLCVHQVYEQQVERTPEAIALVFEQQQLTYRELDERANQLAQYLQSLGVAPDMIVGVCVDNPLNRVIALLGILKTGGAYLPLNPNYPQERLQLMVAEAQATLVIVESSAAFDCSTRVLVFDELYSFLAPLSKQAPICSANSTNLAYVIYTSGSTGAPKGVMVEHRSIVRLVKNNSYIDFHSNQVFIQLAPITFDAATFELWGALLNGARLALVSNHCLALEEIVHHLERQQVSTLWLTAGLFQVMSQYCLQSFKPVQQLLAGGDVLPVSAVRQVLQWWPNLRLVNGYGPTEGTTFSCTYTVPADWNGETNVPIGRPIANTRVYLLDEHKQLVPIGIQGELYIGGAGIARGYLNQPELTIEKFIPDPFSDNPQDRLYKTGDLCRWRTDGQLEYIGRIDSQVKLRGFRVELGEIEAVLSEHPAVQHAAVVVKGEQADDKQLIAYIVPDLNEEALQVQTNESQVEYITDWQQTYDHLYSQNSSDTEALTFNITGWKSSYTNAPIPPQEMQEWVEFTVEDILAFRPQKVLEIGCGTGLLLSRIAPHCQEYCGTDYSKEVLHHLHRMKQAVPGLNHVALQQKMADDFEGLEAQSFDTIILNSVVQYFPNIDYLLQVLEGAMHVVKPGGFIFIGDVRSLPLLEAYHTSIELHKAADSMTLENLQQNVRQRLAREKELVIAPAFFAALKQRFPQVEHVRVQPKRGQYHNELTRFRCQVIVQIEPEELDEQTNLPTLEVVWQDWRTQKLTIDDIRKILSETQPASLGLRHVPNNRLRSEVMALKSNKNLTEAGRIVEQLRSKVLSIEGTWIDPDELWSLSDEFPYDIELSWISGHSDGSYDVVFKHCSVDKKIVFEPPKLSNLWSSYGNMPLQGKLLQRLVPELRQYLAQKLPEYMVPSAWVTLECFPLTPNGKVDRETLPSPQPVESTVAFIKPQTPVQELLANVWQELLGIDRVGIHDNFFELGGHSLLATQLISRIRNTFNCELSVRTVFEYPTVASLEQALQDGEKAVPSIIPREINAELPLSFAQQRLWFLAQFEGPSATYNMPTALRLTGQLNIAALNYCIKVIVQRHETLRTRFDTIDGKAVQIIAPQQDIPIFLVDLQNLPESLREIEAQYLVEEDAGHPFDLSTGALLRVKLLKFSSCEHWLLLNVHHIISDGWSVGVLVKEVTALYQAYVTHATAELPELPIQYADFAVWQRGWLQGEVLQSQIGYWKQQLQGIPSLLELPTDYPRPPVQSFHGSKLDCVIPAELTQKLQALCRQQGVTLFMTLLSAYAILLSRYSGQQDMIIGSPIANRNRKETESLIGFFVNTLVLRVDLSEEITFEELLARVRKVALGAYGHQDVPFEKLVEELQPERSLSHSPLFQVMFALQNAPMEDLELSDLQLSPLESSSTTAKFDLTLSLWEAETGLYGWWEYNSDLFDFATIQRLNGHFQILLESIVIQPKEKIHRMPILTPVEQQQVLNSFNNTTIEYPSDKCIHQLFEEQVEKTPDVVALVFEDQELTYRQLNEKANQLAHYLQTLGIEPEVLVGICVKRSVEMVVGLLGILKAGGAYVPLDPSYPTERLSYMLSDAGVKVLLTQDNLLSILPSYAAQVVCLDTDWEEIAAHVQENVMSEMSADNLAYVIYTSGSSGQPKGVLVVHRGVTRLVVNTNYINLQEQDVVALVSNFSFDAITFEIWGALLRGASLIGVARDMMLSPHQLADFLRSQKISTLFVTTALFNQIVNVVPSAFNTLKQLMFGGEAVDVQAVKAVFKNQPPQRLLHVYGPTENTTFSTWYLVSDVLEEAKTIPIGRPIANTQVYILDPHMQPVPIGVAGELHIGGDGLARGYLNRPDLTASKFVPNLFSSDKSARLYKTGDLARYLSDGNIEFLGRVDHQVKIRGFRIEFGEIESVLCDHPSVQQAVVSLWHDSNEYPHLIAYVIIGTPCESPVYEELQRYLKKKLPEYMVPVFFVEVDAFPLTANGKIDRKALPSPAVPNPSAFAVPRTPLEQQLTDTWCLVLGISQISIHDNFFKLGGDSILSMQIVAKALQYGIRLNTRQLFEHQTVAELAAVAQTDFISNPHREMLTGPFPLIPIQHFFLEFCDQERHHFNQAFLLEVSSDFAFDTLQQILQTLMKQHDGLRTCFMQDINGQWQAQYQAMPEHLPCHLIELGNLNEHQHEKALNQALSHLQASLDLQQGPLLRCGLLRMGKGQPARLLFTVHHLVVDIFSWRVLLEDFATIYTQLTTGQFPSLPPKSASKREWADCLQIYAQSEQIQQQLNYWLNQPYYQFEGLPLNAPLQPDSNRVIWKAGLSFMLNRRQTEALLKQVSSAYQTQVDDMLLAALLLAYYRWSGQKSLLVAREGHGREELFESINLTRTVGWFTSVYPLFLHAPEFEDLGSLLQTVKEQLRAIPEHGVGYGILRYLGEESVQKQLAKLPEPQLNFNYLGQTDALLEQSRTAFKIAEESEGPLMGIMCGRPHLLDITSIVYDGQLIMNWNYSTQVHQRESIEAFMSQYQQALEKLIQQCLFEIERNRSNDKPFE
jgi:microcystin synthetase protein McyA